MKEVFNEDPPFQSHWGENKGQGSERREKGEGRRERASRVEQESDGLILIDRRSFFRYAVGTDGMMMIVR
jgi:hypothetical protein